MRNFGVRIISRVILLMGTDTEKTCSATELECFLFHSSSLLYESSIRSRGIVSIPHPRDSG